MIAGLWVCISLTACSPLSLQSSSEHDKSPRVYLTKAVWWTLPPAATLRESAVITQLVKGRFGKDTFDLLVQLENHPNRLSLVGMTVSGQQLFQLEYSGQTLTGTVSPLVPESLKLSYLVSDLLLAYGDPEILSFYLQARDLQLIGDDSSGKRLIFDGSQDIISVTFSSEYEEGYWPKTVLFKNKKLGYELEIKTIVMELL